MPRALNCWVNPTGTDALAGVTVIVTRVTRLGGAARLVLNKNIVGTMAKIRAFLRAFILHLHIPAMPSARHADVHPMTCERRGEW